MTTEDAKKYMAGEAISRVWRVRSSSDEVVELKYLLENMQDAAELLGRSQDFRIIWSGMENLPGYTDYGKKVVGMSYGFVKNEPFPLEPKLVDVLIGVLQHEMGHVRQGNIWAYEPIRGRRARGRRMGNKVYETVVSRHQVYPPVQLNQYERRAHGILADVNIDTAMIREHTLRGAYIMRGRQYFASDPRHAQVLNDLINQPEPLDWFAVTVLWSALQVYYDNTVVGKLTSRPDFLALADILGKLNELSIAAGQLTIDDLMDNETLKKLILDAGRILEDYDSQQRQGQQPQQGQSQQPSLISSGGTQAQSQKGEDDDQKQESETADQESASGSGEGEDEADADGDDGGEEEGGEDQAVGEDGSQTGTTGEDGDATGSDDSHGHGHGCLMQLDAGDVPMPEDLAEAVFQAVEQEVEDVSELVGCGFKSRRPGVDHERVKSITEGKVGELQESIDILTEIATQRTLGTNHGNLSEELLWKLGTGEDNVFERQNVVSEVSLRLGLVVDISGSIYDAQWVIMQDTIDAFIEAFGHRHDIDLLVSAYHSNEACRIWEPGFDFPCLQDVRPSGSTPTLPALKLMLERMNEVCQERQRTIILSVTDGEPNTGGSEPYVRQWVTEVQHEHDGLLQVIGVGVGVAESTLSNQYDRWLCVKSFSELPAKLKELMLQILLEG